MAWILNTALYLCLLSLSKTIVRVLKTDSPVNIAILICQPQKTLFPTLHSYIEALTKNTSLCSYIEASTENPSLFFRSYIKAVTENASQHYRRREPRILHTYCIETHCTSIPLSCYVNGKKDRGRALAYDTPTEYMSAHAITTHSHGIQLRRAPFYKLRREPVKLYGDTDIYLL